MRWLSEGDAELTRSTDPARSRLRLIEPRAGATDLDPAGVRFRQQIEHLLDRHGAALADRSTAPGHLTGSAVVVDAERRRVLVLLHTKLGRWLQPGGHADGDHELAGVALREATEETGIADLAVLVPAIAVDVHQVDHGDELGAHQHLDVQFLVAAPPGALAARNHESTDLRWVTPEELEPLSGDVHLVRLARRGLDVARAAPPPPRGWTA